VKVVLSGKDFVGSSCLFTSGEKRLDLSKSTAYEYVDRLVELGLGKLIAALRGAGLHFAGNTTQRMVASDIDVRETEAMMIIYALKPALAVGREHDPFFEYLFPDVHDEMDLPETHCTIQSIRMQ